MHDTSTASPSITSLTQYNPRASTTSAVLATLDNKVATLANETAAKKLHQQEHEKAVQSMLKDVQDKQKDKGLAMKPRGFGGSANTFYEREHPATMHMDVDEPSENSKGKNRK